MKRKSRSKERENSRSRDKERDSKKSERKTLQSSSYKDNSISNPYKIKSSHTEKKEKHHKSSHHSKREKEKEKENDYYRKVKPTDELEKEEGRKKIRALLQSFYGYTDDNNPFGDPELSKPFIWHKKILKMRSKGFEPFLDIQSLILKLRNVKKDLDRIRKNKVQRDEMKDNQNEQKNQSKETEEQIFDEWKNKDEKFHLAQEKLRTEIRIKQGREKPVDFIHKVLMIWKGFFPVPVDYFEIPEYQKPYLLFDLLDMESLKELYNELNIQLAIDRERLANKKFVCFFIDIASNFKQSHDLSENDLKEFIEYWSAMIIILESYIFPEKNIKNLEPEMREAIDETLKNKSFKELDEIEHELEKSLNEQIHSADIQFWSNTLSQLRIHRCKMILELIYEEFREKNADKLEQMKKQIEMKNKNMLMKIYNNEDLAKFYEEEDGNLSPPMYESDEELRKISTKQHDYLIRLGENRKIILAHQLGKWTKNIDKGNKTKEANLVIASKERIKTDIKKDHNKIKDINIQNTERINKNLSNKDESYMNIVDRSNNINSIENTDFLNNTSKSLENQKTNNVTHLNPTLHHLHTPITAATPNNPHSLNIKNNKQESVMSSESEEDSEVEKFMSKISSKKSNLNKSKFTDGNKKVDFSGGIHSTNVGLYKNEMNLLLGTGSYPVNTLSASRFYLKDESLIDFNLNNEMMKIESQELGDGETVFNDVVQLNNDNYIWASKYKPRKPRYFNRLKTGYEWNKYNQVHYDLENPPPKVIQGYKFNIFYPDLIDKTKAPQYTLERSDTPDTCMIRFHAGPPYEDIAFKIVNREWDMSEKAGFKNVFDRGILYLYFNFKRYRYKR